MSKTKKTETENKRKNWSQNESHNHLFVNFIFFSMTFLISGLNPLHIGSNAYPFWRFRIPCRTIDSVGFNANCLFDFSPSPILLLVSLVVVRLLFCLPVEGMLVGEKVQVPNVSQSLEWCKTTSLSFWNQNWWSLELYCSVVFKTKV